MPIAYKLAIPLRLSVSRAVSRPRFGGNLCHVENAGAGACSPRLTDMIEEIVLFALFGAVLIGIAALYVWLTDEREEL